MKILLFAEGDLPLSKWLRRKASVVTAWPDPRMGADLAYDPKTAVFEDVLKALPRGFKPEAILLTNLDYHTFLWGLERSEAPVFATITDSNLCFDAFRSAVPFVDLFLCNERAQCRAIERVGGRARHFSWFAVDTDYFRRHDVPLRWDVVFAGNLHPVIHRRRGKLLEKLLVQQDRISVRVVTEPDRRKYARTLASGRIIFNRTIRGERNLRLFEGLGVGRLLLVEDGNEEIESAFKPEEHIATYSDDDLLETIERYLRDERELERIARAGHDEARSRHTADQRADELLLLLREEVSRGRQRIERLPADLERLASRVLLHHSRLQSSLELASRSVERNASPAAFAQLVRTLGVLAHTEGGQRNGWRERFDQVLGQALALSPRSAFLRWNEIELSPPWNGRARGQLERFIGELRDGSLEIDYEANGPVPLAYDRLRLDFEDAISGEFPSEKVRETRLRSILLSRALALLSETLDSEGDKEAAIRLGEESLAEIEDGYVAQRTGAQLSRQGRHAEAEALFERAIEGEPFFFAARRDLAALELNSSKFEAARTTADQALRTVTEQFRWGEEDLVGILDYACAPPHEARYEHGLPLYVEGRVFDSADASRDLQLLFLELLRRRFPLVLSAAEKGLNDADLEPEVLEILEGARGAVPRVPFIKLFPEPPQSLEAMSGGAAVIVRANQATDRVAQETAELLRKADRVWVPSEFSRLVLLECGVPADRLAVVPQVLSEHPLPRAESLTLLEEKKFRFLSISDGSFRSGWDLLLRAYLGEFSSEEDVVLFFRLASDLPEGARVGCRDQLRSFVRKELGRDPDRIPEVVFIEEKLSPQELRGLYRSVDAFVLPSRAESFARGCLEAQLAGLPTIATRWGGQLDYLGDDNAYLIEIEGIVPVPNEVKEYRGGRWAAPSVDHLKRLLRRVFEDPEEGRQRARRAIAGHLSRFHVRRVANLVIEDLQGLLSS